MNKGEYIEKLKKTLQNAGVAETKIDNACKYAENLIDLKLPVIFDDRHFFLIQGYNRYEMGPLLQRLRNGYASISIPKKSGGIRKIDVPVNELKAIQRWILRNILGVMKISRYAMGFCNGKSIVTNAETHVGKKCVINIDLKDFFPSIERRRVFMIFYYYGYTREVSNLLARLCTRDNRLPQGAPTSPAISNIVCIRLDKRLACLANSVHANYSRYADDITFSADSDITSIIPIVNKIIEEEGFSINDKKTRVVFDYQRQEVTGLLVDGQKVRVKKEYLKKIRQEIYYLKKFGVDDHLRHIKCEKRFYKDHMYGKAYFIKMVDKELGKKLIDELNEINWEWQNHKEKEANGAG